MGAESESRPEYCVVCVLHNGRPVRRWFGVLSDATEWMEECRDDAKYASGAIVDAAENEIDGFAADEADDEDWDCDVDATGRAIALADGMLDYGRE